MAGASFKRDDHFFWHCPESSNPVTPTSWLTNFKALWILFLSASCVVWGCWLSGLFGVDLKKASSLLAMIEKTVVWRCRSGFWFSAVCIQVFFSISMWFYPRFDKVWSLIWWLWVRSVRPGCPVMALGLAGSGIPGFELTQRRFGSVVGCCCRRWSIEVVFLSSALFWSSIGHLRWLMMMSISLFSIQIQRQ